MKKILFLLAFLFFAVWLFWKNGLDIFKPLPSVVSDTSSTSVSSAVNISRMTLEEIAEKLKNWGKDVDIFAGFEKTTSSPMNENFSVHMASFNFPKSYFIRSISQAVIDGGVGESFCAGTLKTSQVLSPAGQKTVAGLTFNKNTWSDAGAGNVYQGVVYSTRKENNCYAITLFIHSTQPENYADNETEAKQFRIEHEAAMKKIVERFENMISSLQILK